MKNLIRKITPSFLISWYHLKLAFLGAVFYGFPSRKLKIIGVTGTGGKSTVVDLATSILEEVGYKVASLSSIRFKIGEKEWQNDLKMTMPGRFKIQKFLRQAVKAGCQYAVLEVTSEGIKQHRHRFIDFDTAVFTNLTPEHIERHGSFERYKKAKGGLFKRTKNTHIINLDDESAEYFLRIPAEQKFVYGINSKFKSNPTGSLSLRAIQQNSKLKIIKATELKTSSAGIDFIIEKTPFHLGLFGRFNIYNSLAAIGVGVSQGISLETCKTALEKVKGIPGRMEVVIREPFTVIVDYAHTPDSLIKVYETVKCSMFHVPCSMICVLGACGGGRDKWKRPEMGKIAAQYCNQIILTNEDPYSENPSQILSMIKSGIFNFQFSISNFYEILDRREAIKKALELARPGDTVIITGKGCEPWMCVAGNKKIPWDDREIVKEEFKKLNL